MTRIVLWASLALLTQALLGCASAPAPSAEAKAEVPAAVTDFGLMDLATLTRQAESGDKHAQFALAQRHERAIRTPRNYDAAFLWYGKAAEAGHVPAKFFYGAMFASGRGTPGNIPVAIRWYREAANDGFADAFYPVAYAYENGLGGLAKDPAKAFEWYSAAARRENAFAYQRLANAYRNGELGLAPDMKLASEWQARATQANQGKQVSVVPVGKQ